MGEEADEIEMDEGGGGRSKKMLVVVILIVLLLLSGAAAAYFTGLLQPVIDMLSGGDSAPTEEVISESSIEEAPGVPENTEIYTLSLHDALPISAYCRQLSGLPSRITARRPVRVRGHVPAA